MKNYGPTFRISFSLALLTVSVLLIGDLFGLIPNSTNLEIDNRKTLTESLAIQLSHAASAADMVRSKAHCVRWSRETTAWCRPRCDAPTA